MTEVELTPVADCWVNSNQPDKKLNKMGHGVGVWGGNINRAFLRFSLTNLSIAKEEVVVAEIRLYGKYIQSEAEALAYYTAYGFGETTLTWSNQPPPSSYDGQSLMGRQRTIPAVLSWFSIPIDPVFVKHRWGTNFWVILKGTESPESYFYASDREDSGGAYAPKLILSTTPVGEGKASVYDISLPVELQVGDWITGTVRAQNVGTVEDELRILITTEWNGMKYQGNASVPVGYIIKVTIPSGLIAMPSQDAITTIEAQHLEDGVWVTDDTRTH